MPKKDARTSLGGTFKKKPTQQERDAHAEMVPCIHCGEPVDFMNPKCPYCGERFF